jgi:hypothetical protein
MTDKTAKIRELNDNLRVNGKGGRIVVAGALARATLEEQWRAAHGVRTFKDFNENNDPHGEHDFGRFEIDGKAYIWKIDYYDLSEMKGSDRPENPVVTVRILSIFYAEDY